MIKVATYNIKNSSQTDAELDNWSYRRPNILALIKKQDWDVFGLQEVMADQRADLIQALGADYQLVGAVRDDSASGEYNPVLFKKDRFEELQQDTFWLSATPAVMSRTASWEAACFRIATWVRLRDRQTQQELLFINTHLDHVSPTAREKGAQVIADFIGQQSDRNIFLTGDCNAEADEPFYQILTAQLQDVRRTVPHRVGPLKTCSSEDFTTHFDAATWVSIDYIFASTAVQATRVAVLTDRFHERFMSDHFPVTADVTLA
ncbi:endonuclease/exonuclease/phosphatase family protein [Lapidilactobacillus achengensis]|uniref:Endonuclease/exonuclease/phosphatase family protein n=1 Tax=Lapidilactobacillus achengensis TaxID=2486000 RepID=A0ABW1UQS0_9LACO|nr:endonuclease/exonuclease/phosphatase family protein [Lapidilactobacillus achengensis]